MLQSLKPPTPSLPDSWVQQAIRNFKFDVNGTKGIFFMGEIKKISETNNIFPHKNPTEINCGNNKKSMLIVASQQPLLLRSYINYVNSTQNPRFIIKQSVIKFYIAHSENGCQRFKKPHVEAQDLVL